MNISVTKNRLNLFESLENEIKKANSRYINEIMKRQPKTLPEFTEIPIEPLSNFHNVIVFKSGKLLFQSDFLGIDPDLCWPETSIESITEAPIPLAAMHFDSNSLHTNRSVTKSIVSLLLIKAIQASSLNLSLESPVSKIFPELDGYFPIRICDVLNMAVPMEWDEQGIPYTDPRNPERKMICSDNQYKYSLECLHDWLKNVDKLSDEQKKNIGNTARYNSCTTVLSAHMAERITGKDLIDYANDTLFKPLGIHANWRRLKHSGLASCSSGLQLSPNDMLKMGQSLLIDWLSHCDENDPQDIISLVRKFAVKVDGKPNNIKYGLHFWVDDLPFAHRKKSISMVSMIGIGGNRISILPEERLVCVMTGGNYTFNGIRNTFPTSQIFKDFIFPACDLQLIT